MGYQALLFCPDDKLARVVSQVFNELDFAIDPVNEPFAAVKKLMAQRYDAIVVDCDNEQNTALLFKSARNSSLNQGSLAIALVEGQTGVAKAYRIGANLVLTKPINVEQTKGTLRVARGLLRKGTEAGTGTVPVTPSAAKAVPAATKPAIAPAPASRPSVASPAAVLSSVAPTQSIPSVEEVKVVPAMAASAKKEEKSDPGATAVVAQAAAPNVAQQPLRAAPAVLTEPDRRKEERVRPVIAAPPAVISPASQAAAAAPAPAKEIAPAPEEITSPEQPALAPATVPAKEEKKEEKQADLPKISPAAVNDRSSDSGMSSAPTFAALGVEDTSASGGSKKILIGVAALLAFVALAYFGWTKFGQSHPSAAPQAAMSSATEPAPQSNTPLPTAPVSASSSTSTSTPASEPAATTVERTITSTPEHPSKPSATQSSKTPANQTPDITLSTEPEVSKPSGSPIRVKPAAPAGKAQPQAEEAAAQMPSPLGMTAPSDANLSGVLSTPNVSKPTLARVKLSQGISQGLLIRKVAPKYPQAALSSHVEGAVLIEATINKEGLVSNPRVVKGDRVLAGAALEAVRQWRYKPYYLNGEPVDVETDITINFKAN